jgi:opacity protein-like surface antigen
MRLLLTAALLAATPVSARADIFAAPFLGMKFGGSTSLFDVDFAAGARKFTMGGAVMQVDDGLLGWEASFGYVPGYFAGANELVKPGSFVIDLIGSALFSAPPAFTGGGLRPYAAVGAGLVHAQSSEIVNVLQVRRTIPVAAVGGGATGLFTNNVGVRFDYRYFRSLTTDDGSLANVGRRISYSRFTIGLFLRL